MAWERLLFPYKARGKKASPSTPLNCLRTVFFFLIFLFLQRFSEDADHLFAFLYLA